MTRDDFIKLCGTSVKIPEDLRKFSMVRDDYEKKFHDVPPTESFDYTPQEWVDIMTKCINNNIKFEDLYDIKYSENEDW